MKVGIQARLKNGILWEAAQKMGSVKSLGDHLGIHPAHMGDWINFKYCPDFTRNPERWREVEEKLLALTGCTLDEIFPPEIRNKAFLNRQKRIDAIVEMPVERLIEAGIAPRQLTAPDSLLYEKEQSAAIKHVLATLTPKQEKVIKMRFGLDKSGSEHTLAEVAKELGLSSQRIRQIEAKALSKMRQHERSKMLREIAAPLT